MNRKSLAASGAVIMLAVAPAAAQAQDINVTVDGDVVGFVGQKPVQQFGTVLVPLRGVFEKLGATVAYDGATKTILAVKGDTSVSLKLGESSAQVNGQTRTLSIPAQARNGTTLVPLRFVSEALGAEVAWRGASRTVVISTTGSVPEEGSGGGTPGAVEVTSLTHNAGNALRGGEALTVTLNGTPGGVATFTIPGIEKARDLPMRETSPGTYTGTFNVPAGINVKGATILGSLKKNGAVSPLLQASQPFSVDTAGPTLSNLSPASDAALPPGRPLIYGTLSDAGTGIDTSSTRILVNGKDVTAQATVTDAFFSYRPEADLPVGANTVSVVVRDVAGNETRKNWGFRLSAAEALIQELSFSPEAGQIGPGDVLTVRMKARPGGQARFSIGGVAVNRPMREQSPGNYIGTYTVRKGDSLAQAPVTATFTLNGRTVTQTAGDALTIDAGAPETPTILSPREGAAEGESVTVTGKAAPNMTVRYRLEYKGVLLILPAGGTMTEGEVKADAQGNWRVADLRLSTPSGVRNVSYTLTAVAVNASGQESEAAVVNFKR